MVPSPRPKEHKSRFTLIPATGLQYWEPGKRKSHLGRIVQNRKLDSPSKYVLKFVPSNNPASSIRTNSKGPTKAVKPKKKLARNPAPVDMLGFDFSKQPVVKSKKNKKLSRKKNSSLDCNPLAKEWTPSAKQLTGYDNPGLSAAHGAVVTDGAVFYLPPPAENQEEEPNNANSDQESSTFKTKSSLSATARVFETNTALSPTTKPDSEESLVQDQPNQAKQRQATQEQNKKIENKATKTEEKENRSETWTTVSYKSKAASSKVSKTKTAGGKGKTFGSLTTKTNRRVALRQVN
jgi:hypothetical protein